MGMDWKGLGREVRREREREGLSQEALAEKAQISRMTLHSIESGMQRKRIPPSLSKIEEALGWPVGHGISVLRGEAATFMSSEDRDEAVRLAVQQAALAVSDHLTSAEINAMAQRTLDTLKGRGLI